MTYRPDIDGLRAVAVLSVLFYHAHLSFPGGYVGVDVFFVISGYLIYGLLLREIQSGTFSFRSFWSRRVYRLVPALWAMLAATAAGSCLILLPEDLKTLGASLISQPLLVSNVFFWKVVSVGYFADGSEVHPLLHTWSLGLEEQFYLGFPLVLWLCASGRRGQTRRLPFFLWVGAGLSFALGVFLTTKAPSFAFFTLPSRAWELMVGGLVFHYVQGGVRLSRFARESLGLVGLALIVTSVVGYQESTPFPGYAAAVPCLGTALLLGVHAGGPTLVRDLLSSKGAVRVGQFSYSLYLWHWPLVAWSEYAGLLGSLTVRWVVVALSMGLGYISWRWIEQPFRQRQNAGGRAGTLFFSYAVFTICVGSFFLASQGLPQLWSIPAQRLAGQKARLVASWGSDIDLEKPVLPTLGDPQSRRVFLLWGDSQARALAPAFDALGKKHGVRVLQLTRNATPAILEEKGLGNDFTVAARWTQILESALAGERIEKVFLVSRWTRYSIPAQTAKLSATFKKLSQSGVEPILVSEAPEFAGEPARILALRLRWPWLPEPEFSLDRVLKARRFLDQVRLELTTEGGPERGDVVELDREILNWGTVYQQGESLYSDRSHLSEAGADRVSSVFEPFFAR